MSSKFVFMGSPEFALPAFEALCSFVGQVKGEVIAVFTQPDRPAGRGRKITAGAVAEKAKELSLPLFQPESLRKGEGAKKTLAFLQKTVPDMIVVVAYGLLLPAELLHIPKLGCVNVHASLLPKYRGAAPVQWAIAQGETKTGVSTMLLNEAMDEGPILLQRETGIDPDEYADQVLNRLAKMGGDLLRETLVGLLQGTLQPRAQDEKQASDAPLLKKTDAWISWQASAQEIYNRIRGFYPWPGAQTHWQGNLLKIHRAKLGHETHSQAPGTILAVQESGLLVATGDATSLWLMEVQLSGSKRQTVAEFLRGHPVKINTVLTCS